MVTSNNTIQFNEADKISFDTLCEVEDRVCGYSWTPDNVSYTMEEIEKYIIPNFPECLPFAIWLLQKTPENKYEKEAKNYLMNLVNSIVKEEE